MKVCPVCKSDKWMVNNSDFSYKCNKCGNIIGKPGVVKKKVSDEDRNEMVKRASDQLKNLDKINNANQVVKVVVNDD